MRLTMATILPGIARSGANGESFLERWHHRKLVIQDMLCSYDPKGSHARLRKRSGRFPVTVRPTGPSRTWTLGGAGTCKSAEILSITTSDDV